MFRSSDPRHGDQSDDAPSRIPWDNNSSARIDAQHDQIIFHRAGFPALSSVVVNDANRPRKPVAEVDAE